MIDIQILRYLYSNKNNGIFYDVSRIFNVVNPNNYFNEVENDNISPTSINSTSDFGVVSRLLKRNRDKDDIDRIVVSLEENGYVEKRIPGNLPASAVPIGDDPSNANNSICRITTKGIEYYENHFHNTQTRKISVISLLLALIAIFISVLSLII
ncbi:MAG: hypothetical protein AB9846_14940 [Tenuifilaceae bacterium]